jgi:hypothetical protein
MNGEHRGMRALPTGTITMLFSLRAGRPEEARDLLCSSLDYVVSSGDTEFLACSLELSACITADLGGHLRAARLAGAAEAIRHQAGMPSAQAEPDVLEQFLAPAPRHRPAPGLGGRSGHRPLPHPGAGGHVAHLTRPLNAAG